MRNLSSRAGRPAACQRLFHHAFDVTTNKKVMNPLCAGNSAVFTVTATSDSRASGVNTLPEWMVGSHVAIRVELEAFEGDSVPYYPD